MSKNKIILIIGIVIAIIPFLGFPSAWRSFFVFVGGVAVSTLSYLIARENRMVMHSKPKSRVVSEVYVESHPKNDEKEEIVVIEESEIIDDQNNSGNN
jgi:uncharacterized protein YabE (DUF348 family)